MKDNCTMWPEGNWSECCARHDKRYSRKALSKFKADILLYRCVKRKHSVLMAAIMFLGVTIFGHFYYNKGK